MLKGPDWGQVVAVVDPGVEVVVLAGTDVEVVDGGTVVLGVLVVEPTVVDVRLSVVVVALGRVEGGEVTGA